jgi:hypothetical protein
MVENKPGKLTVVLITLACILSLLALTFTWVRNQTLDTNRYVETVAPLASNKAIQSALADATTKQIEAAVDPKSLVTQYLPPKAAPLAGPISAALTNFTHQAAEKFFASPAFPKIWTVISRRSHEQVVNVLEGKKAKFVELTGKGQVTLDVTPLVGPVRTAINKTGLKVPPAQTTNGKVVIFDAPALASIQGLVRALNGLTILFTILAPLLFIAAIAASKNRRRTVVSSGLALAGTMALLGVLLALGRWFYLDTLPATVPQDASAAFFDTLVRYFARGIRITALFGLVVAFAAWWTGGGKNAFAEPSGKALASLLRVGAVAIGAIVLLAMPHPTAVGIVLTVVITAGAALLAGPLVERSEAKKQT